ncbi:thiamine phosphate synthase [Polymorphobacter fuscus]|uniref:Thiamine-phosphate synthase n=1 Tax=Sandarakinorhabdus fusca TaxID=1439888 RepID=A0A7C9KVL2_9SPHN|nr:thiamine phosphate synthase [Polymorphobacter fuscus]KAB7648739.1 thiamine phosphate synthase [Polymorphobacter fuscus]MQT16305.1 thiamine phosphate synthase [Polymorphobacter fuscus]NJC07408.1 thiamine-phosphate pyrophosphorylase [Polymorphobacter fuscus]
MTNGDELIPLDPGFGDRFARQARPACQLYVVSPPAIVVAEFADHLRAALQGGPVAAFQLRLKDVPDADVLRACAALLPICQAHDVAFLLNDRADLAKAAGADGVHLGQSDGGIKDARALLGPEAQIGRTCHDSRHLAMEAGEEGADYVAFGAFYETTTKPSHYRPAPEILTWWTTISQLPCVAIGGITPANAAPIVAAGADFVAVVNAVWQHPDGPGAGVRAFEAVLGG